jgi:hypothetical protein
MRVLELFSGTHSIGKVAHSLGWEVISLDRDLGDSCPFNNDYKSDIHIKEDIMTWNYKEFPKGHFDLITASPVCLWWSGLKRSWIGRKCKSIHPTEIITQKHIDEDIERYGKPMVDKVFEIIEYFEPKHWWIENPATGRMKEYITDKPFYDVDYCKYSDWGYRKRTRFWTNIENFEPKLCKKDCNNLVVIDDDKNKKLHKINLGNTGNKRLVKNIMTMGGKKGCGQKNVGGGTNILERYRIPENLIEELFLCIL